MVARSTSWKVITGLLRHQKIFGARRLDLAAQAAYNNAIKAAKGTLAGNIGDANITAATDAGSAGETNVSGWNALVAAYTNTANGAETSYVGATNSALAAWVNSTTTAENTDASSIAGDFQTYIGDIGQAEVDYEQDNR